MLKVKCLLIFFPAFLCSFLLCAQLPEDALRLGFTQPSGTAREQAIGGAMGSLGGDLSSNYVNPAGLGFYKTGELLISPSFSMIGTKASYLSNNTKSASANHFMLGTSGLVLAGKLNENGNSTAFSLAVTRSADFNGHTFYKGNNSSTSGAQAYADEFGTSGLNINDGLSSPSLSYGTRMAIYTYLIDTSMGGSGPVIAQPNKILAAGGTLSQTTEISSTGGITEIALSLANSSHEKWYLGASLGIPIMNYQRTTRYTESDISGKPNNDFGSYSYTESYSAKGAGVNLKVGAIYRPNLKWRFGLAVHSPSLYSITDKLSASMVTNTEGYHGLDSIYSATLDQAANASNTLQYDLTSPWHFIASGSYIFPGALQAGKMGFITADIEYITYKSPRFNLPADVNGNLPDNSYFAPLNSTIRDYYKNNLNFRLGGEFKIDELAFRLGGSYSMNPYSSPDLKVSRSTLGGGIGYRKKGIFIDLTFVQSFLNEVDFPYRLANKDNYYASVKRSTGNIILTMGFKF